MSVFSDCFCFVFIILFVMRRKRRGLSSAVSGRKRSRSGRFTTNAEADETTFVVEGSSLPVLSQSESDDSDDFIVVNDNHSSLPTVDVGSSNAVTQSSNLSVTETPSHVLFPLTDSLVVVTASDDNQLHLPRPNVSAPAFSSADDRCAKCLRESTDFYPLDLQMTTVSSSRKFGNKLRPLTCVKLCHLCEHYVNNQRIWKYAWPSVLCTMIFFGVAFGCNGEYFFNMMPPTIAYSWLTLATSVGYNIDSTVPLFNDFTVILNDFDNLMSQQRAQYLKKYFNYFTFPFVKCPAGCSSLIKEAGVISFKHLLNRLFPKFVSFRADASKLTSMRNDFLSAVLHLEQFLSSPCLSIDEDGLNVRTCGMHSGSLSLKMFHIPRSPLGNLIHPESDRLAVMASKLRVATPCKPGTFSHSFTMSTSVGGPGGISSLLLTTKRRFNVKSENLLPEIELLMFHKRPDIRGFLGRLLFDNELDGDFMSFFRRELSVSEISLNNHLESSTFMTSFSILSIKQYLERVDKNPDFVPSITICHNFDNFGAAPIVPHLDISKSVSLFLCTFLFNNHEFFGHTFMNVISCRASFIKFLVDVSHRSITDTNAALQTIMRNFDLTVLPPTSAAPLSLLSQVFEKLPSCEMIYCPSRESLSFVETSSSLPPLLSSNNNVYVILVLGPSAMGRCNDIPRSLFTYGREFLLSCIYCSDTSFFTVIAILSSRGGKLMLVIE